MGGWFSWNESARDIFVFDLNSGQDQIHDFEIGVDKIKLKPFDVEFLDVENALTVYDWGTVINLEAVGGAVGNW